MGLDCRSEPARDEPENAAGCQVPGVIVDDHREQARSYRAVVVGYKAFILDIAPSGA
jgi:cobyrinic acid a,c-diamide synthase